MNEWRNVRGYEVLEADTELREEVELYKIKSFIDMVDGHDYVGVALTGGWSRDDTAKPPTSYDQFEVESWPLVQAFGIADFGTGGFFTMKHRVLNVSQHLSSIYSHIDAHAVKVRKLAQLSRTTRCDGSAEPVVAATGTRGGSRSCT